MYAERNAETRRKSRATSHRYIFIGPAEQQRNSAAALAKFAKRDDLFQLVFDNARTAYLRIRR
jgi:hypothetical protein